MRKKSSILLCFLLYIFLGCSAAPLTTYNQEATLRSVASPCSSDGQIQFDSQCTILDPLTHLLSKNIHILSKKTYTFSYTNIDQIHLNPFTISAVLDHISGQVKNFSDSHLISNDQVGPGFYVSIDPVNSRSYGGTVNPGLFVVPLKKGARILDGYYSFSREENQKITGFLKSEHCRPGKEIHDMVNLISELRQHDEPHCRQILISAVKTLDIQAILYYFNWNLHNLKNCDGKLEALNILSNDIIDTNSVNFYSNTLRLESDNIAGYVSMLYQEKHNFLKDDWSKTIITSLQVAVPSLSDYEKWKRNSIYSCGKSLD